MSMEMTGNATHPKWRLGEIGEVLRSRMAERIDSVNQLNLYMQRNEADLIYGSRLILQIDAILDEVRRAGLSKDVAVAVESSRPGTIPEAVRKILTSNYTRTHQKETIVALESWANAGKVGLVVLIMTAIIKIIGWIISNGNGFAGNGEFDGEGYAEKVGEKAESFSQTENTIIGQLKISAVKDAYIEASKGLKGRDLENLNLAIAMADEVFTNMNAEEYLNDLSSALGRSPFTELFKGYTKKRQSSQQVIHDLLDTLLQHNVTYGIYPIEVGKKAWQALPKSAREAGVRIPNLLNFQQMSNVASELIGYFGSLQSAFKAMIDPSVAEGFKNQQGSTTTHNGKQVNKAAHDTALIFGQALAQLNTTMNFIISDVSRKGFEYATAPLVVIPENKVRGLVGHDDGVDFVPGKVLVNAQASAFLGRECLEQMRQAGTLSVGDERELLAVVVTLGKQGFTNDTAATNLNRYSALDKAVNNTIKVLEQFQKATKDNAEYVNLISEVIMNELNQPSGLRTDGRELSMVLFSPDGDEDLFVGLRRNLSLVRRCCGAAATLQTILNLAKRNPLVKGNNRKNMLDGE
ncbi:hypothetical protein A4K93_00350 [Salmonella enterica subsp. enterica serovar Schwarzengrund]|uniref:Uncharacterized protein n=2 Tax=Salmonella enterica I TaxID=59201 RepID=A0A5W3ERK4_SALET|nr:hypothetical protein [Salmonella enterica subsp. enterica serovar Chester]EBQ5762083.1 hypothetical protein [Salmonella enterica]EBR0312004.1 hypothetical protein [Salmonella enterica subsp. enterica serovar Virchow]EBU9529918.1 hypothetical protein [Salmonella enterica subsp. enterica serovar Haifa]EBW2509519.1 hypothetical protein [Salmonella enterica subsp. enterica serovar Enteritidis]EBW6073511.1 hypothetical protein [Salmonella enterica subsp. enterica serovar Schwarzengrund]ECG12524